MISSECVKPRPIAPGDIFGLAAPAGTFAREEMLAALKLVRDSGFEVHYGPRVFDTFRYMAGPDRARAAEIQQLLSADGVAAILCIRGGFGSTRLLDLLDWELFRAARKPLVGYSDLTALLNHLASNLGIVCFHGPTLLALPKVSSSCRNQLFQLLQAVESTPPIRGGRALTGGRSRGRLLGGNLSLLISVMGTPYEPCLEGSVLVLEDVGERPYRIDRMLTQLRLAGKLEGIQGLVVGQFGDVPGNEAEYLQQLMAEVAASVDCPMVVDFPVGHGAENFTLPLGVQVELDADQTALKFLDPPCAP